VVGHVAQSDAAWRGDGHAPGKAGHCRARAGPPVRVGQARTFGRVYRRRAHHPIAITAAEATAVAVALAICRDQPFAGNGAAALTKLVTVMDERTRAPTRRLSRRIWIDDADPPTSRALLAPHRTGAASTPRRRPRLSGQGRPGHVHTRRPATAGPQRRALVPYRALPTARRDSRIPARPSAPRRADRRHSRRPAPQALGQPPSLTRPVEFR
jgi:hypothetical protein